MLIRTPDGKIIGIPVSLPKIKPRIPGGILKKNEGGLPRGRLKKTVTFCDPPEEILLFKPHKELSWLKKRLIWRVINRTSQNAISDFFEYIKKTRAEDGECTCVAIEKKTQSKTIRARYYLKSLLMTDFDAVENFLINRDISMQKFNEILPLYFELIASVILESMRDSKFDDLRGDAIFAAVKYFFEKNVHIKSSLFNATNMFDLHVWDNMLLLAIEKGCDEAKIFRLLHIDPFVGLYDVAIEVNAMNVNYHKYKDSQESKDLLDRINHMVKHGFNYCQLIIDKSAENLLQCYTQRTRKTVPANIEMQLKIILNGVLHILDNVGSLVQKYSDALNTLNVFMGVMKDVLNQYRLSYPEYDFLAVVEHREHINNLIDEAMSSMQSSINLK